MPIPAFDYAQLRSEDVKDMMFVNLFQALINNPQMMATEPSFDRKKRKPCSVLPVR